MVTIDFCSCKKENNKRDDDRDEKGLVVGTFIDARDQQEYNWVEIGSQIWMSENLNYKTDSGWVVYDNDTSYREVFGLWYDWGTACEACPDGWHLPSSAEWDTLIEYLGGEEVAGAKLKSTDTTYWKFPIFKLPMKVVFQHYLLDKYISIHIFQAWDFLLIFGLLLWLIVLLLKFFD